MASLPSLDAIQLQLLMDHLPLPLGALTHLQAGFIVAAWPALAVSLSARNLVVGVEDDTLQLRRASTGEPVDAAAECAAIGEATDASPVDLEAVANDVLAHVETAVKKRCAWLHDGHREEVAKIRVEMIRGMSGGDMVEFEVNPQAAGTVMWWPDAALFTPEHHAAIASRVYRHGAGRILNRAVIGVLSDLPHEAVHCLQGITAQQHFTAGEGSEWSAEHDASVAALNLMQAAIESAHDEDVGSPSWLRHPGLFETVYLFLHDEVSHLDRTLSTPETEELYRLWTHGGGLAIPTTDAVGAGVDFAKVRAALEGYPLDIGEQLRQLVHERPGDVRGHPAPARHLCGAQRTLKDLAPLASEAERAAVLACVRGDAA